MITNALVHLGAGIGNVVLATPLLIALRRLGLAVDVWLAADYRDTDSLLTGWDVVRRVVHQPDFIDYDVVVPAVPPFYWPRFETRFRTCRAAVGRPPDALFYRDEQEYYFAFARALGFTGARPRCALPIAAADRIAADPGPLVLAPGCKTGEMAAKRWPHFPALAERFTDVVVVGTPDDLNRFDGSVMRFPAHCRSLVGSLSLRDTAAVMATAATVVANDSGLGHVAAAVGAPTILLFGPTSPDVLGQFAPNVTVVRAGWPCEPCWSGARLAPCRRRVDCLAAITPDQIEATIRAGATLQRVSQEEERAWTASPCR
jgi:ADP-heptose:LPS heptosyltransferase